MLTREIVRKEIRKYSRKEDKPVLLWLLDRYSGSGHWQFLIRSKHVRHGPMSYETHRVWYPTREGRTLYQHVDSVEEGNFDSPEFESPYRFVDGRWCKSTQED